MPSNPVQGTDAWDELPEYEELTPELMEDECLRGDVMLRWALVLLAVLLSWTTLTESPLLVNIRSGEYMLSHGLLPPRVDVFSGSAEGRAWVNPGWLSDLLLGGLHQTLGFSALTILCVITVAVAFRLLSAVGVPGVSTWWGTCCGLLALLALFPVFQPGAASLTVLGLSLLMLLLSRESLLPANAEVYGPLNRFSWSFPYLPLLFLLWFNLETRAWTGLLLLLVFMAGDALSRRWHGQRQSQRDWGVVLVTGLVAALLTPWPMQALLSPFHLIRDRAALHNYAIVSEFFPRLVYALKDPAFWKQLDLFGLASVSLLGISFVTLLLNVRRLNAGWLAVWLAANLLSVIDGDWVCYAAIVNAVVATLNGQAWYRETFSMDYSIDRWSVVWGRGGRAATVLTLLAIAYLGLNGTLMGPQGRRIGLGLDPRWSARIQSLEQDVVANSYTDRIFPTLAAQGDLLIWIGKKPFIDSRVSLYLDGPENLLETHQKTRTALFSVSTKDKPVDPGVWKQTLLKFKTYDVLVRLWGPLPPYEPMLRMVTNTGWVMTGLGAAGANFTRIDLPDEPLIRHAEKFAASRFSQQAFRPEKPPAVTELSAVWPLPVSRYDRWLIQKRQVTPNAAELAAHYESLLSLLQNQLPVEQACGLAFLAVRECRQALAESPNDPMAYRVMARVCRVLRQIEQQVAQAAGVPADSTTFDLQTLAAVHAAILAGDSDILDQQLLLETVLTRQQQDVSLQALRRFQELLKTIPAGMVSPERKQELTRLGEELQQGVDAVRKQVEEARTQSATRPQLVSLALQGRCPSLALTILNEDLTELERSPELKLLYSTLLMQTGDFEQALQMLEGMEALITAGKSPQMQMLADQWRNQTASVNLAMGNLERAIQLGAEEDNSYLRLAIQSLIQMPFASMSLPIQYELWPAFTARMAANAAIEIPERVGHLQLQTAQMELELGRLDQARQRLENLLKEYPQCSQRFVAAFYLTQLTGKRVEVAPLLQEPASEAPVEQKPDASSSAAPMSKDHAATGEKPEMKPSSPPSSDADSKTDSKTGSKSVDPEEPSSK